MGDLPTVQGVGDHELASVVGTALLQVGRVDDAVVVMERTAKRHPDRPALEAALTLAMAAAGRIDDARARAVTVAGIGWATYLDRVVALLGLACAEARAGETAVALKAVDEASDLADSTDDILTGGIVALAQARVLEAAGSEAGADAALADADARLARVGIDASGWDDLFRAATGTRALL
jgi:ATP/maltotriose-dependent transcriptional regulator MalT